MAVGGGRDEGYDDGLLRDRPADPLRGTWVDDQMQFALARVDALTRELEHVETALRSQSEEVSRLHDSLGVVEGRTVRHEVGQEQTREVRQEIAELEERLAQEAALRRDLAGQVDRFRGRDAENQQELMRSNWTYGEPEGEEGEVALVHVAGPSAGDGRLTLRFNIGLDS